MSSITYDEALKYLCRNYAGVSGGLSGVRATLGNMGNPHNKPGIIHVAGTNGKGSTCAFLKYILMAAGFRVGVFTSPHLKRYNERIAINLQPISDDDFARCLAQVIKASKVSLSFFEILTCMAYGYFAESDVDIAIIETGIGGRLDATNVIERPLLSVITAPGYDHEEILGETLEEIAYEDAGIIKDGCPVAVYPTPMVQIFKDRGAPFYYIGHEAEITGVAYGLDGTEFSVKSAYFSYQSLSIRLLGKYQVNNAVHALLCVEALRRHHKLQISDQAVNRGLKECMWPGRFELVPGATQVVLDGAHNEDGARKFKESMELYFSGKHIVLVVGISNGKNCKSILQHMQADTIICTNTPFKAMNPDKIANCAKHLIKGRIVVEEDYNKALVLAEKLAGPTGVVAVAGSLYLVGALK